MEASQVPALIGVPFGASAGGSYIRPIPVPSQIGIQNGAASYTDGFPPWCFQPGGYPWGQDVTGILNAITLWNQWNNAGGPIYYSSAFSTAIGGYPQYALLASASVPGAWWQSTVDNNTSDPDIGGANWTLCTMEQTYLDARYLRLPPVSTFYVDNTIGNNSYSGTSPTVSGTIGPWATLSHAASQLSSYNFGGETITVQLGATGTYSGEINVSAPGAGTLVIRGNPSSQSSYVIAAVNTSASGVIVANGSGSVELNGVTVASQAGSNSFSWTIGANSGAQLFLTNTTLTSGAAIEATVLVEASSQVIIGSGLIIEGAAGAAFQVQNGGAVTQTANASASGPVFSVAFVLAQQLGLYTLSAGGWSWSGSSTGPRYSAVLNGVINTNGGGANFFPGSSAGSTATGGQYA